VETYYATVPPTSTVDQQELSEDPMIKVFDGMEDLSQRLKTEKSTETTDKRPGDYLVNKNKEAMRQWKEANPNDTIHRHTRLLKTGKINRLPWHNMIPKADLPTGTAGQVRGFGISFPDSAVKGDMFLRVDRLPTALYKFNGVNWIEVDKTLTDQHAYNDAYIDHLIEKISTGEYDPELLSDAERECIEQKLKSNPFKV
jgi:hypothetical protein